MAFFNFQVASSIFIIFNLFLLFIQLQFLLSLPCPLSLSPSHPHIVVHGLGLCINVLWLIPSPSFIQSLHPLSGHCRSSVLCIHASGSILFISLLCSLDSTSKWHHVVFVSHGLAYFAEHTALQVHRALLRRGGRLMVPGTLSPGSD